MAHFVDRLLEAAAQKGAPVCVGIDPVLAKLPSSLVREDDPVGSIETFCDGVLEAVAPHAPIVKFQSACFERYFSEGLACLHRLIGRAHDLGLMVILDAKRGDIGSSAAHYAGVGIELCAYLINNSPFRSCAGLGVTGMTNTTDWWFATTGTTAGGQLQCEEELTFLR